MTRCTNPILSMFLGSMLMLAQACDQGPPGEIVVARPDPGQNAAKVDVKKDEPAHAPSVGEEPGPSSGDDAPVLPPPPSGRPGDEIPNNGPGYGGGSQGALEPVPTGGEDDDEDNLDFGVCGDGIQEVLHNTKQSCPHLLYGSTTSGSNGPSTLVYFNVGTGQGFSIATISNIHRVSAIDFSPEGGLYAVGVRNVADPNDRTHVSVFAKIDCLTGEATIIGPTLIEDVPSNDVGPPLAITDINFSSQGQLWAFLTFTQYAGTINFATGEFTPLTPSIAPLDQNSEGNGLAFFPFPNNQLYTAGESNLVLIDQTDGEAESSTPLAFPGSLSNPRINAMDNDPLINTLYVSIQSDGQNNLGILDIDDGDVSFVGTLPVPAPTGLDGLAVNRLYEECDTGPASISAAAPAGTTCINCDLVETNCADGIDNDFNGLTDCEDDACEDQPCDDGDSCTLNDVCTATVGKFNALVFECIGTPLVCNDFNPCTTDSCDGGSCFFANDNTKTSLGSCEEDGRACTVGKCALDITDPDNRSFICFETNRSLISDPTLGCNDGEQCSADSCVESWTEEGQLSNGDVISITAVPWGSLDNVDAIGNVLLDNDWQCVHEVKVDAPCFDPTTCRDGSCILTGTDTPDDPLNVECIPDPARACGGENPRCAAGETCIGTFPNAVCAETQCPNSDNNECVLHFCNANGSGCTTTPINEGLSCHNSNLCLQGATCVSGVCTITDIDGGILACPEPSFPNDICKENLCNPATGLCPVNPNASPTNKPDGTELGGSCTLEAVGICAEGSVRCLGGGPTCISVHTPVPEICNNGLDDNCNGEVDENCPKLVFITYGQVTGNFDGVFDADSLCQSEAASFGKTGTFKAWLSDSLGNSPNTNFTRATIPYVLADGTVIANNYADLTSGTLAAPINRHADNTVESPEELVWTDTESDGTASTSSCNNWSSASSLVNATFGFDDRTDDGWTDSGLASCSDIAHFYCFEQ